MKFRLFLLSLFLIILISGCRKNTTDNQIIGKWNWAKTIIPYGNIVSGPLTTGYNIQLRFLSDGMLNEYRNDTLLNTSEYKIETSGSGQPYLKSSIISSYFSVTDDSLIFNEAYVDGPVISYFRVK